MILSWLPVVTNCKFCKFSRVLCTALSPSLLMKLFPELHRQLQHKTMHCCCCPCSLHNDMKHWEKEGDKCTPKFKLKMRRKISILHYWWGYFPVVFFFFFLYQIVVFLLFIHCFMQLFASGYTEWMTMNEAPGNAFLQGFHCSRWWKKA